MTISTTVILGIITGIASTFITSLSVVFFKTVLVPRLQSLKYNGLVVSGKWIHNEEGFSQDYYIELDQTADIICGTATFITKESDPIVDKVRTFKITGFIKDGIVALHSLSEKQNRLGVHTLLLKADGDGRELSGIISALTLNGLEKGKITSTDVHFFHESVKTRNYNSTSA